MYEDGAWSVTAGWEMVSKLIFSCGMPLKLGPQATTITQLKSACASVSHHGSQPKENSEVGSTHPDEGLVLPDVRMCLLDADGVERFQEVAARKNAHLRPHTR